LSDESSSDFIAGRDLFLMDIKMSTNFTTAPVVTVVPNEVTHAPMTIEVEYYNFYQKLGEFKNICGKTLCIKSSSDKLNYILGSSMIVGDPKCFPKTPIG